MQKELERQIDTVKRVHLHLTAIVSLEEKIKYLFTLKNVQDYLSSNSWLKSALKGQAEVVEYLLLCLLALDQGPIVLDGYHALSNKEEAFSKLVKELLTLENFYSSLGGIIGYHLKVLTLIEESLEGKKRENDIGYFVPPVFDLRKKSQDVEESTLAGIKSFEEMAEVYPVGGAGDRLHLTDERTGEPKPAACLHFLGKTLFECLIRDLQAREYLYFKLFGKKLITPIVLMTSHDKMNDEEIEAILDRANWFGRPKESIFRFMQPLTPVITVDGNWATHAPLELITKPGGHGVIWKLAQDQGAFSWLKKQKRKYILIRQINNPLAGVDGSLLAICGYGIKEKMTFGFATCPKREGAAEGVVALELKEHKKVKVITNVEYTELTKSKNKALKDEPFPANTNILFAEISEIERAIEKLPIPGMLVNMKLKVQVKRQNQTLELQAARLESTMQNIADALTAEEGDKLKTFVAFNERSKTISVTKKSYQMGGEILETPEGAFYDLLFANFQLLKDQCKVKLEDFCSPSEYMQDGPSHLFLYHPALGPLYSIIAQKIQGGEFKKGSELQLEIAEVFIKNLHLDGSLVVKAENVIGEIKDQKLNFSEEVGRLVLENVTVKNAGVDRKASHTYWKQEIIRKDALKITLEGHSEFIAQNVVFSGNFDIIVPHKTRAHAFMGRDGKVEIRFAPLSSIWQWNYTLEDGKLILSRHHQ